MQFIQSLRKVTRQLDFLAPIVVPILAVLAALAVGAIFLLVLNVNPGNVYIQLVRGAVGSTYDLAQTLGKATPLLLVAIGICIAFRANVLNIGAEGQVIIGGIATAAFALAFPDLPSWLLVILSIASGFLGGAVWGGIAGALKAWFGVNEILSTIMMNQIALRVLLLLLTGPMRDPSAAATSANIVQTAEIPRSAFLPTLYPQSSLHTGLLLAIALAFVVYFFLWRTVAGYRIRATGANPDAARYAGIHVRRTTVLAIALSGGFAGIAGSVEVLGVTHRALQDFTTGYGFSGIVVALFGLLHPVGAIPAAALFGGLLSSSTTLQSAGISSAMVTVLQGLVVIFVVGSQQWTQRTRRVREQEKKPDKEPGIVPVPEQETLPS
jgi:general nucleoside transport system permease protein